MSAPQIFGVVKWYDSSKGFGFIARDDKQPDVFVHAKQLEASGLSELYEGQNVSFDLKPGRPNDKRLSAHNVKVVG